MFNGWVTLAGVTLFISRNHQGDQHDDRQSATLCSFINNVAYFELGALDEGSNPMAMA